MKWKYENVKEYIESFGYKLASKEYKNCKEKLHLICPNGNDFIVRFDNFKNAKQRCKCDKCKGRNPRMFSYEYVKNFIENEGYKLLSKEYNGNKQRIKVMCPNGHEWKVRFTDFKNGRRCYYCSCCYKPTVEEIRMKLSKYGYTLLSKEYNSSNEHIDIKCPHGHKYSATYHNFDNGKRCPYCSNKYSKGEYKLINLFNNYKIDYKHQYIFNDCRDTLPLPFDFYLYDYNCCIEFDGEGHYEPRNWNGASNEKAIETYELTVSHDAIKTQYCNDNNIKLIRIPYWEYNNIEKIICQELNIKIKQRRKGNKMLK